MQGEGLFHCLPLQGKYVLFLKYLSTFRFCVHLFHAQGKLSTSKTASSHHICGNGHRSCVRVLFWNVVNGMKLVFRKVSHTPNDRTGEARDIEFYITSLCSHTWWLLPLCVLNIFNIQGPQSILLLQEEVKERSQDFRITEHFCLFALPLKRGP